MKPEYRRLKMKRSEINFAIKRAEELIKKLNFAFVAPIASQSPQVLYSGGGFHVLYQTYVTSIILYIVP